MSVQTLRTGTTIILRERNIVGTFCVDEQGISDVRAGLGTPVIFTKKNTFKHSPKTGIGCVLGLREGFSFYGINKMECVCFYSRGIMRW